MSAMPLRRATGARGLTLNPTSWMICGWFPRHSMTCSTACSRLPDELENWSQQLEYKVRKNPKNWALPRMRSCMWNGWPRWESYPLLSPMKSITPYPGSWFIPNLIYKQLSNPDLVCLKAGIDAAASENDRKRNKALRGYRKGAAGFFKKGAGSILNRNTFIRSCRKPMS